MTLEDVEYWTPKHPSRIKQAIKCLFLVYISCLSLVIIHELGHALVASLSGMKIHEISVDPVTFQGYVAISYFMGSVQAEYLPIMLFAGGGISGVALLLINLKVRSGWLLVSFWSCLLYGVFEMLLVSNPEFMWLYVGINTIAYVAISQYWINYLL